MIQTITEPQFHAEPHISLNARGHATINGKGILVRDMLDLLLTYRSLEDVAVHLEVGVEYCEAAVAYAAATIR